MYLLINLLYFDIKIEYMNFKNNQYDHVQIKSFGFAIIKMNNVLMLTSPPRNVSNN